MLKQLKESPTSTAVELAGKRLFPEPEVIKPANG